jgi:DNA-binding LacI/PurR family transcriptional regulator
MQIEIQQYNIPYIVIDSHKTDPGYPCIRFDYELGAYVSTNYLISQGHMDIGFIGMGAIPEFYMQCFTGYKRALNESNLNAQLNWIQSDATNAETSQECMKKILECSTHPTAVFCASDLFAVGAMNYLQKNGYKVPDDFSFTSIDNILLSQYCYPNLTTINLDKSEMGVLAMQTLDNLINKKKTKKTITIKSDNLIIRDSVCKK